jgi:peptide/nickel transport system substrate-binding protein
VWDVAEAGWGPDWFGNAALSFFGPLFSGPPSFPPNGSNFGFYDNPKVNDLIKQATAETDETKAADIWAQADRQVMEDAAFFPEITENTPSYHAAQVHNAIPIPAFQSLDFANVWIDKDKQGG